MSQIIYPPDYDYKKPDVVRVLTDRYEKLRKLREDPARFEILHAFYKNNVVQFTLDWGCTFDPRAPDGQSKIMPFILFPAQADMILDFHEHQVAGKHLIVEKSRDVGASWCAIAYAVWRCIYTRNFVATFGSRKKESVDDAGNPDALLWKVRKYIEMLPVEFRAGFNPNNSPLMRVPFPKTESIIKGEIGENIGRGGRTSLAVVDECAHLENDRIIDAALSANTRCRIDLSSVNGMNNSFAERRHSGKWDVFTFHWTKDPRKDQAYYDKFLDDWGPVITAQELDLNYRASLEGLVIPATWVQKSIGLAKKLNLKPQGERVGSFDVADRGMDRNAFAVREGVELKHMESWSGKESDIFFSTLRAFLICDQHNLDQFTYDTDGLGSGVRGDAREINERRKTNAERLIDVDPFQGSGKVINPTLLVKGTQRKNEDFFANYKAQAWWNLRLRFQESFRAAEGKPYDPDEIISIDPDCPELPQLLMELSQPQYKQLGTGKIVIEKQPDNARSPNLADAVMMCYAPKKPALYITQEAVNRSERRL